MGNKIFKGLLIGLVCWNMIDFFFLRKEKTAYVELGTVYEKFAMKKEYENMVKSKKTANQNKIDSLEFELKQYVAHIQSLDSIKQRAEYQKQLQVFVFKKNNYLKIKNSLDYSYEQDVKSYDDKIWARINTCMKEYAEENGLEYVFGVTGNGTLMHADSKSDMTNDFVEFLNKKYSGEKS